MFDPVLLAFPVDEDLPIAELLEPTGGGLGVPARGAAVDDDLGVELGEQAGRHSVDLIRRDVDGSRQVGVSEVGGAERLDEDRWVAALEFRLQILPGDRGHHFCSSWWPVGRHPVIKADPPVILLAHEGALGVMAPPRYPVCVRFGILGPLAVGEGDTAVEIRRGIPRTLLIALLLRAGETVGAGALMELLWGDNQPRNPANALQIQVSYLRKMLAGAGEDGSHRIVTRAGGYAIELGPDELDAHQFDRLVREATARRSEESAVGLDAALELLDGALGLWRGDPLEDVAGEPFAIGEITRLEEARWAAVEDRNDVLLALGRHRELVGELGQLVNRLPLRERFHDQLMVALYRSGRQADALRAYAHARRVLVEELGLEPGSRLQELERAILAQDRSLDWGPPAGTAAVKSSPPPTMPAASPGRTLPAPVTSLVGREAELTSIRQLLGRTRMLTLTGPAGGGKSRLALELAQLEADRTSVWFVDLASVTSDDRVAAAVAAALGVPSAPEEDTVTAVTNALAIEGGLLLLDTCERVLPGVAEVASRVLRRCPGMRILATSRRPLGITGEIAWPVPPLALPPPRATSREEIASFPAVALFCERAEAVRPSFALTESTAADVAAICLTLDGLPLALELAAARADVLTPAAILARLQNRFDLLVEGGRDAATRQQTLRAALDWSFELLEPDQRRFFARLGVFASSFGLDAAVTVAGEGFSDPLSLLSGLVRQSMVTVAGEDRYRLLDTLRAYAVELVDEGEHDTRHRHARYYTDLAEVGEGKIVGPDQVVWLANLRADVPNFRAALEWSFATGQYELAARLAGALGWFWTLEGMLDEAIDYLERAVAHTEVPPLVRSKALWGDGLLAASLGRLDRARQAGAESADLARAAGDAVGCARGLNTLAVAEWALGNLEAAAQAHDEAISLLESTGDLWGLGVCTALRARTALDAGDADGERLARAALPVARASGDQHVIGIALEQLAQLDLTAGRTDSAKEAATECLAMHQAIGYREGTVAALHVLARSVAAGGDAKEARQLHLRALSLATRIGHVAAVCEAFEGLAALAAADHDFEETIRLLEVAHCEREAHDLPLRAPDRRAVDELRQVAEEGVGAEVALDLKAFARGQRADAIVARLLAADRR